MKDCIFCKIIRGEAPAETHYYGIEGGSLIITPLNPVTPGHLLVIPRLHLTDAVDAPEMTALVMADAARYVRWARQQGTSLYDSVNLITSVGAAATQTVFHLHVHIVPRAEGDGLHLPWTGQVIP